MKLYIWDLNYHILELLVLLDLLTILQPSNDAHLILSVNRTSPLFFGTCPYHNSDN